MSELAMDALHELGKEGPLEGRVAAAWIRLAGAGNHGRTEWLQDAEEVRAAYREAEHALGGPDITTRSEKIQGLIISILMESGYVKAIREVAPCYTRGM